MIISKYDKPKTKAGTVISETTANRIEKQVDESVVQKAQQVAATTTSEIAMTATVNAAGELIMTTDIAVATAQQASA